MNTFSNHSSINASRMEHEILAHVKQALRVVLDWKAPAVSAPQKLSSVQFTLKSFERHFQRLLDIEEDGGYLSEVADAKPNLQPSIDRLASDHSRFRSRVRQMVPYVDDLSEWQNEEFQQACEEIRELLDEIDDHDREEMDLLQDSLLYDEGGEG